MKCIFLWWIHILNFKYVWNLPTLHCHWLGFSSFVLNLDNVNVIGVKRSVHLSRDPWRTLRLTVSIISSFACSWQLTYQSGCFHRFVPSIGNIEKSMWVWADRAVFGSTGISAVKAKVCYFRGYFFHVFMGKIFYKTEFLYMALKSCLE